MSCALSLCIRINNTMMTTKTHNESNWVLPIPQECVPWWDVWTEHSIIHNWLSVKQRQCSYLYFSLAVSYFPALFESSRCRHILSFQCRKRRNAPIPFKSYHLSGCGTYSKEFQWKVSIMRIKESHFSIASYTCGWCYKLIIWSDYEIKKYIYISHKLLCIDSKETVNGLRLSI